jgi:hypothetical protein
MKTFMAGSVKGTKEDLTRANAIANCIAAISIVTFLVVMFTIVL